MARIIAIFLILCVFACSILGEEPVNIPDQYLKAAIEVKLGVTDPNTSDMLKLTSLTYSHVENSWITDLTGLEYAINLTELNLRFNTIKNISPIEGLTNLTYLALSRNQISDITPLAKMVNLTSLFLHGNFISDISPLAGLKNLQKLTLEENNLSTDAYTTYLPLIIENNPSIDISYYLNPPKDVSATDGAFINKVQVVWESFGNALGQTTYQVYRSLSSSGTKTLISDWQTSNCFEDTTAVPCVIYYYYVKVKIEYNDSTYQESYYSPYNTGYVAKQYNLTISSTYGGDVIEPGEGVFTYLQDTSVKVVAEVIDHRYIWGGWIGTAIDAGKVSNPESAVTNIVMNANYTLQAIFVMDTNTIYVDDNATGTNDGSSWENAYNFLQNGLLKAKHAGIPVTILVAQGTYTPDMENEVILGDRAAVFQLINSVTLQGGYAGNGEPDPNVRDIEQYKTILSGDLNNDDALITNAKNLLEHPSRFDNSYHVLIIENNDSNSVLDGVIVTGGYWPYNYDSGRRDSIIGGGGGLYCKNSSIQLKNCTFECNGSLYSGGVIFSEGIGQLLIDNCKFIRNASRYGGAILNNSSEALIKDCVFRDNYASEKGGAMRNVCDNLLMTNCLFENNLSDKEGGAYHNSFSDATISNCIFKGNFADYYGGGIFNTGQNNLKVLNSIFKENSTADYGAGIFNVYDATPLIENCLFINNTAGFWGGAIQFWSSKGTVSNCTITNNHAISGGGIGSGFWNQDQPSNFEITNCILWNNGQEIYNDDDSQIGLTYSCVKGLKRGRFGMPGNCINDEPCFVNSNLGDYHLKSEAGRWDPNTLSWVQDDVTSPCIDAGDPNSEWGEEVWPHGKRINMGAYGGTSQASMSLSDVGDARDLNNDDVVTWDDILLLIDKWDSNDVPLKEDLNLDGVVDVNDLAFYENWTTDSNNTAPVLDSIEDQYISAGNGLSFTVSANDNDGDELVYKTLGLLEGAEFSRQNFTWVPEHAGTYLVTFVVSDYKSLDYLTVKIIVKQE